MASMFAISLQLSQELIEPNLRFILKISWIFVREIRLILANSNILGDAE